MRSSADDDQRHLRPRAWQLGVAKQPTPAHHRGFCLSACAGMTKLRDAQMPLIPFGEYRPDITDYDQASTGAVLNALPRGDGYGPMPALSAYSAALPGACRGFFKAIKTDGSVAIFAATATKLWRLDNTNQTWTDVSKGGGYSAVSSTDQWQFVQYINYVIAVQANAAPQFFDLTVSTAFADLAGSPPQARYAAVVGSFVVLSGLVNNPYRVQWSALGDPTGWTAGVNSSSFQDLPDGGIVRGVAGGEFGNIFQDTAIRRLVYAPGSPVIFQIERISDDRGLYAPYSLIRSGDQIFFLGPQGFAQMDPSGYPAPIGKEKVNRTFLADLDTGNLQLVIGASDPRNNRVFWAYKSTNGAAGLFDKLICYDHVLARFAPLAVSGEFLGSLSQPGLTLENLDSISGSLDALIPSLDSFATSVTPGIAAFDASHKLGFFRGASLEAQVSTGAQAQAGRRVFVRGFRPVTDAGAAFGAVGKRERLTDTETFTAENAMDAAGSIPARASSRYVRAKLRIPAGTAWSFALGVEQELSLEGAR